MEQCVLGGQYLIHKKIGAGSFGEIYSGENTKTHRQVAIKLEKKDCKIPQLYYESKLYAILQGGPGISSMYWYGNNENYNALVFDLHGKSLETLFKQCNSHFSLKTVLMLADQMLGCLEYFHEKNYIHRDIKPDNFVMGLGSKSNQVFLIDFGLAKRYRDTWSHQHIQYSTGNSLTGTARYSSLNALKGSEQSRRDDLEALGYVLLYFLRGGLPWMGKLAQEQDSKYYMITYIKEKTTFEDLCCDFPDELVQYFYLVRNLAFAEKPNYSIYRKIFRDLFIKNGFIYDDQYDWVISSNSTNKSSSSFNISNKSINKSSNPISKSIDKSNNSINKSNNSANKSNNSIKKSNNPIIKSSNTITKSNNPNNKSSNLINLSNNPISSPTQISNNNNENIIKQEPTSKPIQREQQINPTLSPPSKQKRAISSAKSEDKIEIKPKKVSSTPDPKKLIENPDFKKKNPNQNQNQQQIQLHKDHHHQIFISQQFQPKYFSPSHKTPLKLEKNLEYTGKIKAKT